MLRLSWASVISLALTFMPDAAAAAGPTDSVLNAVNAARAKAGCSPLRLNAKLTAAAKHHARAMAEQDFFGHAGKDGSRLTARIERQGYVYRAVAENIAAGQESAGQVMRSWMESPGHRRNILNCQMKETGIAVTFQPDDKPLRGSRHALRYYWVQVFAVQ